MVQKTYHFGESLTQTSMDLNFGLCQSHSGFYSCLYLFIYAQGTAKTFIADGIKKLLQR